MKRMILAGLKNWVTTLFGAVPGALVALTQLLYLVDGDAATVFDGRAFMLAAAAAVAFLFAGDAPKAAK